jgi:uncharacterized coiled-coil protein SlyX
VREGLGMSELESVYGKRVYRKDTLEEINKTIAFLDREIDKAIRERKHLLEERDEMLKKACDSVCGVLK